MLYAGAQLQRKVMLQADALRVQIDNESILFLAVHSIPKFSIKAYQFKLSDKFDTRFVTEIMSKCLENDPEARPHPFDTGNWG